MSDVETTDGGPVAAPAPSLVKASLWHRLYHGETTIDFVKLRKWGALISGTILLLSVFSLGFRGLNLGIEFEGGVTWEYARGTTSTDDAEGVLADQGLDLEEAKVQTLNSSEGERVRVTVGPLDEATQTTVRNALASMAGVTAQDVSTQSVGPSWGDEITRSAIRALVVFFVLISIYISLRFEWKMAIAAIAAVVHDVLISVGIYSLFQFSVTPATVIAFLTILGYSLYDTIVVFDKVHENTRKLSGGKFTYSDVVNLSMNQTLMRSLNTSISSVLPVLALLIVGSWIMGAVALQDFAVALLVGMITGAYSSIFIATPILAMLKEREPRYRQLRERVQGRSDAAAVRAAAAEGRPSARPGAGTTTSTRPAVPSAADVRAGGAVASGAIPPRPRKKKRR